MSPKLPTKCEFDHLQPELVELARDWADRECGSFDEAVRKAMGKTKEGAGSIWDMPAIDSKSVVGLLAELEPALGCKLPSSFAKRGGYETVDELVDHLFAKIREKCPEASAVIASQPNADQHLVESSHAQVQA